MTAKKTRIALLLFAALAFSGCSIFKKGAPKTPVLGERVPVLISELDVAVDPATASIPMVLPEAETNTEWAQAGGNASKSVGHVALGNALANAFSVSIGYGTSLTERLASPPVIGGGRIYTIDANATVRAFDAQSGGQAWESQFGLEKGNSTSLYGGGVAYDNNRVYASNGLGYVAALDVRNGGVLWQVHPGGPLRGSPTIVGDTLYVISQDNQIYSLKTRTDRPIGRTPRRSKSRACSGRVLRPSGKGRWSRASRRASSTPTATRTADWCGRTRCRAPASAPAFRHCRTSTPVP